MKVTLLEGLAGDLVCYGAGQVIDVPADQARRLIARGSAEPFIESPAETAVQEVAIAETTAATPAPAKRRRRQAVIQ